ncbi:MAG: hypothetical protein U0V04_18865 [Spirosomataceae bacterium]
MSKQNKRRNFDGNFKAKVALEAIQEKMTLSELILQSMIFSLHRLPIGRKNFWLMPEVFLITPSPKKWINRRM